MVTDANGRFSSAVLAELRARGIPAVGGGHTPSSGQRDIDFNAPGSLDFDDTDTLLLVSVGAREDDRQITFSHVAVGVAERDDVSHIVCTNLAGTDDHLSMALLHRATERIIMASGVIWTILRNDVYAEILGVPLSCEKHGEASRVVSPLGDGAVAAMARCDLACAAASVLSDSDKHGGEVYGLMGSHTVSVADVAVRLDCEVRDISPDDYRQPFTEGGMPSFRQSLMFSIASVIQRGFLTRTGDDLPYLLDREPTNPLAITTKALTARRTVVL